MANDVEIVYVESKELTCPGWMMTFGDCMSLLLCFFVLLLTFSTKDDAKLMDVMGLIKGALSPVEAPDKISADEIATEAMQGGVTEKGEHRQRRVEPDQISPVTLRTYEFTEKRMKLEGELKAIGFSKFVSLSLLDEGISLRIDVENVFEPNSYQLTPNATQILEGFAILCTGVGNEVRLTAKIPSTQVSNPQLFSREWRMNMERIAIIGEVLTKRFNISNKRISYGTAVMSNVKKGEVELLLVEKVGIKQVSEEDLTKELLERLKEGGN